MVLGLIRYFSSSDSSLCNLRLPRYSERSFALPSPTESFLINLPLNPCISKINMVTSIAKEIITVTESQKAFGG